MTGAVEPLLEVVPSTVTGPLVPLWVQGWVLAVMILAFAAAIFVQSFGKMIPTGLSRRIEVGAALLFYPSVLFLSVVQLIEIAPEAPWWRLLLYTLFALMWVYWALWALKHRRFLPPGEPQS